MNKLALPAAVLMGAAGLALLQSSEGLRLKAYLDPVGIPTICYGHTGPDVKLGQIATRAQCDVILQRDIEVHWAGLSRCVNAPLLPNQRDALIDFTFNTGVDRACNSTLVRKVNARDYAGAANEFPKWVYGKQGGRVVLLRGLQARRTAERTLFLTPSPDGSQLASTARFGAIHARYL